MLMKGFFLCFFLISWVKTELRSFTVDYENDRFLLDEVPFRYISGSIHYFRIPYQYWSDRLKTMRQSGLNAISTYVEWSSHEPVKGSYLFSEDLNLTNFLDEARKVNLLVLLRVGPYICAERDLGGLPSWLLNRTSKLRTSDYEYEKHVAEWFDVLLPMIKPFLYHNGGPIIMVQSENEYGSYPACSYKHTAWLRDYIRNHLGPEIVLYTTDGWYDNAIACGQVDKTLTTIDFGTGLDVLKTFSNFRSHKANGPLVNSEFYPGWLDRWTMPHQEVDTSKIIKSLRDILNSNASVNFYMFFGGTSFGLKNGANWENDKYLPQITSYDYDSPMNEAGDPNKKYSAIRRAISDYLPLPPGPEPLPKLKMAISLPKLKLFMDFSQWYNHQNIKKVINTTPLSFEQLGVLNGLTAYSTTISKTLTSPAVLKIKGIGDRGYVFVDMEFQGIVSRMEKAFQLPVRAKEKSKLVILVENQGRINFGKNLYDPKGIIGNITLGMWNITESEWEHRFFNDWEVLFRNNMSLIKKETVRPARRHALTAITPAFLRTEFVLKKDQKLHDTYLNPINMTKGIAYLNGYCLGRYWPDVGPQVTLFTPGVWLKPYPQVNELIIFEQEPLRCILDDDCYVQFQNTPIIDAPTPALNVVKRVKP